MLLAGAMVAVGAEKSSGVATARRWLEESEFNSLYARTARPLAAYIRRMTSDADATADLLQETYLRVLRSRVPVMGEKEMNAYLYKTASRVIRDRWRHSQVDRRWRERLPERLESRDGQAGQGLDVDRILGELRPRDRAIVWLTYVEGRSHSEIAGILGIKRASVRVLLFRARRKLAGLLTSAGLGPEVKT
jgi:RNA polymerase sigma-70 factor (ECF subfamily)